MYSHIRLSRWIILPLLLLIPTDISHCQEPTQAPVQSVLETPFEYTAIQAVFLEAKSAKLFPKEDRVLIQTEDLDPIQKPGIVLSIEGLSEPEIEVTTLIDFNGLTVGLYPPQYLKPNEDNTYSVLGKTGDRFGIRARTSSGVKQIYVEIQSSTPDPGEPDPPPTTGGPTPDDISKLSSIASAARTNLNDPITARYLTKFLSEVASVEQLKLAIPNALIESMVEVNPPYKDWRGQLRVPVDAYLVSMGDKVKAPGAAKVIADALVKGLTNVSLSSLNGTIRMYTRDNCTICLQWKQQVWPTLARSGWKLQELPSQDTVPSFVICNNDKCSPLLVGYLSVEQFNEANRLLKD